MKQSPEEDQIRNEVCKYERIIIGDNTNENDKNNNKILKSKIRSEENEMILFNKS